MRKYTVLVNRTDTFTNETGSTSTVHSVGIVATGFNYISKKSINKPNQFTPGIEFYGETLEGKKYNLGCFFPLATLVAVYEDQYTNLEWADHGFTQHPVLVYSMDNPGAVETSGIEYLDCWWNQLFTIPAKWSIQSILFVRESSDDADLINFHLGYNFGHASGMFFLNQAIPANGHYKFDVPEDLQYSTSARDCYILTPFDGNNYSDFKLQLYIKYISRPMP